MIHFNTLGALAFIALMSTTGVLASYKYLPEINGWVRIHKVAVKWEEAFEHCENQSAVLMSPNNMELYSAMVGLNEDNSTYYIGAKAEFDKTLFVSIEGVPLYDMPVSQMSSRLRYQDGDCLSMNRDIIRVVPCTEELPFICYKEKTNQLVFTECGTFDKGYKPNKSTGSCYKYHDKNTLWSEAYSTCIDEGAYLVIINDENEAKELQKIIEKKDQYVSIGVRCIGGKGNWRSIHGHRLQEMYDKWYSDDYRNNFCMNTCFMPKTALVHASYVTNKFNFMCEKDPNNIMFPEH